MSVVILEFKVYQRCAAQSESTKSAEELLIIGKLQREQSMRFTKRFHQFNQQLFYLNVPARAFR